MPLTYSIGALDRTLNVVARGSISYEEVIAHLRRERADGALPMPEFIDARDATAANLTADQVRLVVEELRALGRTAVLGPTAVVVGNEVSFGVMRMLETLVSDVTAVRPFRDADDARRWLSSV